MSQPLGKRPAAFIDRDGTLIEEVNFLSSVDELSVFPFTAEALALLKERGYHIVVVTNQSGIGRGFYSEKDMDLVHAAMQQRLGGIIDGFYHCPHLPDEGCDCRKPNLGMLKAAAADLAIDLENSFFIGDKKLDVLTARNAGIRSALVLTGYGQEHAALIDPPAELVAENLLEAVKVLVNCQEAAAEQ